MKAALAYILDRFFIAAIVFAAIYFAVSVTKANESATFQAELNQTPSKVLLFSASENIAELHHSLIAELPETEFVVVFPENSKNDRSKYTQNANVTAVEYDGKLTDWVQDRVVRFADGSITSSFSDMLWDGGYGGYELAVPELLNDAGLVEWKRFANERTVSIDAKDGEIYRGTLPNFKTATYWGGTYGDGGDRVANSDFVFVGSSTLEKIRSNEKRFEEFVSAIGHRSLVAVDSKMQNQRFGFHIDMYMTVDPENPNRIFLANPEYTMQEVFGVDSVKELPEVADAAYYARKIAQYKTMRAVFDVNGFEVIDMPILFIRAVNPEHGAEQRVIVSYNNGVYAHDRFLTGGYDYGSEYAEYIERAEQLAAKAFDAAGYEAVFLKGAGAAAFNFGVVRCSTGIVAY